MRQKLKHTIIKFHPGVLTTIEFRFGLQNTKAQFIVCRMQVNHEARLQAAANAVFKILDFVRGTISGDHNLLVLID